MALTAEEGATAPVGGPSWIAQLIDLERDGDRFVAERPSSEQGRLFGGQVAAQGLGAAGATVPVGKLPQSLHAYFVRAGRPGVDVEFVVERTRDGRSFDTRRVTATQEGKVILELLCSFHVAEPGADWHAAEPPVVEFRDAQATLTLPELDDRFEIRVPEVGPLGWAGLPYWIRTRQPIEEDPLTRACTLTYVSDMGLMAAARPPGTPLMIGAGGAASLDHAIWFQRPFVPERWHRYEATRLNNSDSRGLALGSLRDQDGQLVATMAQEALWREPREG